MPPDFYLDMFLKILYPFVPFVVMLIRFKKMDPAFHSLIFVFGAAILSEFTRFVLVYHYYTIGPELIYRSRIGYNIYVIIIGMLYTCLFYKWGIFNNQKWIFKTIMVAFPLIWLYDNFIYNGSQIHEQPIIYRLFYAFFLCLFAIQQINRLLITERRNLLKNAKFLICFGILFFFLPYIIAEGIFLFNPKVSLTFRFAVSFFRSIANPLTYLIFTLAVLWIPPKKNFIQLS